MNWRGVVFDLGGVVLESPLRAIAGFERANRLPPGLVNDTIAVSGPNGAWACLERGELSGAAFHRRLADELAAAGHDVDTRALMAAVQTALVLRPHMLEAVSRLRGSGLVVAACTNNWEPFGSELTARFDVFVESVIEHTRKPERAIYEIVLDRMGLAPSEVVMLDDLGLNLRPARELGMATIKVEDPDAALAELGRLLDVPL